MDEIDEDVCWSPYFSQLIHRRPNSVDDVRLEPRKAACKPLQLLSMSLIQD